MSHLGDHTDRGTDRRRRWSRASEGHARVRGSNVPWARSVARPTVAMVTVVAQPQAATVLTSLFVIESFSLSLWPGRAGGGAGGAGPGGGGAGPGAAGGGGGAR